ncbi:type II toxin-antitoxin system HicA family toxin [Methylobacter sp.]|uniref:type II toxin-antitoxin system HicA family toxin n=1 Tax=Methylobacter sp. TaxID=2051955 RepID=UPI002FDD110B
MKSVSGKRLCRLLEIRGWELKRINGSHHIYAKSDCNLRISVPVHGDNALKIGLQKQIMKMADIDESEL